LALGAEVNTSPVIALVIKEGQLLQIQFGARVKRLARSCFQVSAGKIQVRKSLVGDVRGEEDVIEKPMALSDIWRALRITLQADDVANELVHSIWHLVYLPLWKEKKTNLAKVTTDAAQAIFILEAIVKAHAPSRFDGDASVALVLPL
jgi:hypothetical protein